jgi:peptidoglycan LD-endopeptidase LytH
MGNSVDPRCSKLEGPCRLGYVPCWPQSDFRQLLWLAIWLVGFPLLAAPCFRLPTENRALFEAGGEDRYFVGTVGKPWLSGTFGCVRTAGQQMHEGIDIRALHHDRRGEPTDGVYAVADGVVAYMNPHAALSNYGRYLVLLHRIEGLEIYSVYAHLSAFASGLAPGRPVRSGDLLATMGRTTNTRSPISKDRAHLHFELNLLVNDRFPEWYKKNFPTQRNDHRVFNGQNMLGLDPREILMQQSRLGTNFSLLKYTRQQTELCHVWVRQTRFPWLQRYAPLVWRNPRAEKEGVAGYELVLNYNGVAYQVIPRAASEINSTAKYQLLSVNAAEQQRNPARHLLASRGGKWTLTPQGIRLLDLYTYP